MPGMRVGPRLYTVLRWIGVAPHRGPWTRAGILWWRVQWTLRAAALAFIATVVMIGLDGYFYYPSREMLDTPATWGLAFEDAAFSASDGVQLAGWFIPALGTARGTVVHFHGNAENMSTHVSFVTWLPPRGYNLFTFDYRGYGRSEGRPTRAGTIRDGLAAVDYVLSRKDVDPRRVFIFGQSLGAAIATVVAAERPAVRAVALDSPFSSYRRIGTLHLRRVLRNEWAASAMAWSLLSGGYEPTDYVARIAPRPLLIVAGGRDEICFPELAQELFDAARDPKELWFVPEAAHTQVIDRIGRPAEDRILRCFESAGD